ncbi:unnamed protein product [Brachionus calyciflorus]|uniref:Uncharacterized protein n=1 Tax=Brachionus calyciflorus TaxID=104777 RepID=A0A813ML13_9BILA|nr:unnamed protein product [Brachionus calyciflorus]
MCITAYTYDPFEYIIGDKLSHNNTEAQSAIRQAYSRLSTMYCMLSDYYSTNNCEFQLKPLNLETLALKWMDPSYEIREAAQALLKNELKRIGPNGRAQLIKTWEPHLSSFLKDFDDLNQTNAQATQIAQSTISLASTPDQAQAPTRTTSPHHELAHLPPTSNRMRRKQFVAVIILSLIGAEFGQDVSSNKNQAPYRTIPQGFSLEDHSILKRISNALSNLVSNKALQYDITRRAAIDLMGRGFTIWEPFIQPTYVLLSLLELSADAELYLPRLSINLPLTSIADLCKIARNSLSIIANSKPKTFILTIAKEIKRINSTSSQSAQVNNMSFSSALTRGKPEILKIIERLSDNQSQDVYELLSDVIEIVLFCLDPNLIRSNGFEETFPALFKFPMLRYCKETKRIICGCHNGRLVVYEYKASKWNFQSYPAHNGQPIVAVAVSSDSKYVASYSAHDNSLIFWQSSGGNIFNIGSNTIKQIKTCNAAPTELSVPYTKLAYLFWQNRTLNLIYHDNRKFSYQI